MGRRMLYEKNRDLEQYLALSPTRCKLEPYSLLKANMKPNRIQAFKWCHDLELPQPRFQGHDII